MLNLLGIKLYKNNNEPPIESSFEKKKELIILKILILIYKEFNELSLIYKCRVEIISYVMTWNGIVTKYHKSHLKRLEIPMNVEAYIMYIVLKKTVERTSFDRRRGLESGPNVKKSWERASMGINNQHSFKATEKPTINANEESKLEEEIEVVEIVERNI
ncbi:hypothetical protein CWI38_0132p0030 [Hamiltosporidium tvaerminnensis]|uniref:Uncharacterized protein n=1 Tax=Hamiltosporidium tvaerminnensis TaxID=1176355 RepID=A0A4Q9M326_9MICR|nr:hypothetical protein CWI38_0132p0030 [Hamiltosporidium tvaerminnensis]